MPALAVAPGIETNVRRLLARESTNVAAAAERAGRVPGLAALATSSIDHAGFQDALSTAPWWKDFRSYGCAVLMGKDIEGTGEIKVSWLPPSGLTPVELARAVDAKAPNSAERARLVSGPTGFVLGALAPVEGVKGARVLLAEPVDRQRVAALAARANVVMMLSDGRKDLGASVPDATVPLMEGLVGRESAHVMVEKHLGQLAVAVPWADGLWLWVVTGWEA